MNGIGRRHHSVDHVPSTYAEHLFNDELRVAIRLRFDTIDQNRCGRFGCLPLEYTLDALVLTYMPSLMLSTKPLIANRLPFNELQ
jgi:hypothetical protein